MRSIAFPLLLVNLAFSIPSYAGDTVEFDRDIRPILAAKCYACHGPDAVEVQSELRLDQRAIATKADAKGHAAIVPGQPGKSELIARIDSTDESLLMPPPESRKKLTAAEKQLLKQWITDGAEYKGHWSFIAPKRPSLPAVNNASWGHNAVDRFLLARLEAKKMSPSTEAGRETLIRRVSFDLRGLPPSIREIDEFLTDSSPRAYEKMVDRMLASAQFGEKMGRIWMDLARYGDTNGYHYDSTRQVWMWRDWVIRAFNENKPFDEFTVEQLAGDLLPNATVNNKIASGFNRNTRYNEEGGADPAEWRVEYAKDRTRTLGQVWLGLTLGCADCHSHKYDPITQTDFYQLYAFFNSLDEPGAQGHRQKYPPLIEVPTAEQERTIQAANQTIATLKKQIRDELAKIKYEEPADVGAAPEPKREDVVWIDDALPNGAKPAGDGVNPWNWVGGSDHPAHSGKLATQRTGTGLTQHYFTSAKTPLVIKAGDILFSHVLIDSKNPAKTVQLQFNDGTWEHRAYWGENHGHGGGKERVGNHKAGNLPKTGEWIRIEVPAAAVGLKPGAKINGWAFTQFAGTVHWDSAGITRTEPDTRHLRSLAFWEKRAKADKSLPNPIKQIVKLAPAKRNAAQQKQLLEHYLQFVHAESRKTFAPLKKELQTAKTKIEQTKKQVPFQLVSVEMAEPRPAHLLIRGDFKKPGKLVQRDVPTAVLPFPKKQPKNRLGLARWVVDPAHPLTARVTVNRYWAQLFGRGIVETVGDFGHLGRYPTHPQLLDWLAVKFVESGWDTKHVIKLMVMSAGYRQSSVDDRRHAEADPQNYLLWRAPRFRLPGEEIRDTALRIAGLLSPKVGGPPVFPYQPVDYYKGKQGSWKWNLSTGEDRYRRGMYTFWRRTTPYPTFVIFDAPDRSECMVARSRTITPLQALVTMNEPLFVDAARAFGRRIAKKGSADVDKRLIFAFRLAVAREPNDAELAVLRKAFAAQRDHYAKNKRAAASLVSAAASEKMNIVETAAWIALANTLLNLDETITRE
jgi:hypothetical protein